MAVFAFKVNNDIVTFSNWEDIPPNFSFDHVITFKPDYPKGPHTPEEHDAIGTWNDKLKELMKREKQYANNIT